MPFLKVDEEKRIQEEIEKDPEYKKYIDAAQCQLDLINTLVSMRQELNLTRDDVAKRSGLTKQMVCKVETFDTSPTLDVFIRYVQGLGATLSVDVEDQYQDKACGELE